MKKITLTVLILFSMTLLTYAHSPKKTKTRGIRQIVMVKFKAKTTAAEIAAIDSLALNMGEKVKPIRKIEWGKRIDENGTTTDYDYCLMLEFKNETDMEIYQTNPLRLKLMGKLIPLSDQTLKFTYLIKH